jgi:cytochrome c oxidase subunit III
MPQVDVFNGLDPEVKYRTKKMMMWFIVFAVLMLFAGLTSAMIVSYGRMVWMHIDPPKAFWVSNALIVLSSLTLIISTRKMKAGAAAASRLWLVITFVLGIAFAVSQNSGWSYLSLRKAGSYTYQTESGAEAHKWHPLGSLVGDYGTDFWFEMQGERLVKENGEYYIPSKPNNPVTNVVMTNFNACGALISVLVYVHIIHLVLALLYLIRLYIHMHRGKVHPGDYVSLSSAGVYWHFLGFLWLYLFAFIFYLY